MSTLRDDTEFQPLPATDLWAGHLNLPMKELQKELQSVGRLPTQRKLTADRKLTAGQKAASVYSYVLTSIHLDEGQRLRQLGTGPNFQGGRITLCTCKYRMRAALEVEQWPGQWIVGLSSRRRYQGHHWLVFIMRVQEAYASHAELWQALPPATRRAKSARRHVQGVLLEPKGRPSQASPFDTKSYHEPVEQRTLNTEYEAWGRPAALLVGDPEQSWGWTEPRLYYKANMTQGYTKWPGLPEFLAQMEEAR